MAEAHLISTSQGILNNLISMANQEISLAWGFEKDLESLKERLTTIEAMLRNAKKGSITSELLLNWLKSIQDVTGDAENMFDEIAYEGLRRKLEVQNQPRNKVHNLFSCFNPLQFHVKMAHKVQNINLSLDGICRKAKDLGLSLADQIINSNKATALPASVVDFRQTHPVPVPEYSKVVGRDEDVLKVVDMLLGPGNGSNLPVIAIVGMPGLGKTTLAQLVYKNEKVVRNFAYRQMWVSVSDNFNVVRLLDVMVQCLTRLKPSFYSIYCLREMLRENIKGKKYLLVLDDVWNTDATKWELMKTALLGIGGPEGSRILITTRNVEVASTMETSLSHTHNLGMLSPTESWTMFSKRAFAEGGPTKIPNLEEMGERMVKKCNGLPLAIKSLGALLFSKKDEEGWASVESSDTWRSILEGGDNNVLPILRLSFDNLPSSSLKQCFAYCSTFPKDYDFEPDLLIQLWMAQGYLQPPSGSNLEMEDVGKAYFETLLRDCLFQNVRLDWVGNVKGCKMHDLVHDLALRVSGGNCLSLKASEVKVKGLPQHLQHLLLEYVEDEGTTRLGEIPHENVCKLRTLIVWDRSYESYDYDGIDLKNTANAKSTRVLRPGILPHTAKIIRRHVGKFIHLRYLDLSRMCVRTVVPYCIVKLYNLQTLVLPRHSDLRLVEEGIHNLVNLRHLFVYSDFKPRMIGRLSSLRTLSIFSVGKDEGYKIEELGSLSKLRGKLTVCHLCRVKDREEAERANIKGKLHLQELDLQWIRPLLLGEILVWEESEVKKAEEVLEGLVPHWNLKGLILQRFAGRRLASWMMNKTGSDPRLLENLVKIELSDCENCEEVPALGHLPNLKTVKLFCLPSLRRIGPEFYGLTQTSAGGVVVFPALKQLTLSGLSALEEWSDVGASSSWSSNVFFPALELLHIDGCCKLVSFPSHLFSFPILSIGTRSRHFTSTTDGLPLLSTSYDVNWLPMFSESVLPVPCFTSLQVLQISNRFLASLPKGFFRNLTTLVALEIDGCHEFRIIDPDELVSLTSLRRLKIVWSPRMVSCWDKRPLCLTGLQELEIDAFSKELGYFPWPSSSTIMPSLKRLFLRGSLLSHEFKSLPLQVQHLTALTELTIEDFAGLEALPEWMGNLPSLESLKLYNCAKLARLPSLEAMQSLTSLQSLSIVHCPFLEEGCERESGQEWQKISHIPSIYIR